MTTKPSGASPPAEGARAVALCCVYPSEQLKYFRSALALLCGLDFALRHQLADIAFSADAICSHPERRDVLGLFCGYISALVGGEGWVWRLLCLQGVVHSFFAMINRWPKANLLAVFILLTTVQLRSPALLNSGDALLRVLIFMAIILPTRREANRVLWMVYCVQLAAMYWTSALCKVDPVWRSEYQALAMAISPEMVRGALAPLLLAHPEVMKLLTRAALLLEEIGPVFLFFPTRSVPMLRYILWTCFTGFHLGIFLTLNIGLFPLVAMVAWLPFLPLKGGAVTILIGRPRRRKEALAAGAAFGLCVYIVVCNACRISHLENPKNSKVHGLLLVTEPLFPQRWNLFAPRPDVNNYEFFLEWVDNDGETLLRVSLEKLVPEMAQKGPLDLMRYRFTKFQENIARRKNSAEISQLLRYCATRHGIESNAMYIRLKLRVEEAFGTGGAVAGESIIGTLKFGG